MEMLLVGIVLGAILTTVIGGVGLIARAGSWSKLSWGLTAASRATYDTAFANKVNEWLGLPLEQEAPPSGGRGVVVPGPSPVAAVIKPTIAPGRLLAVLQSEARLVDFLMEDLGGASDAQIAQAVRDIHRKAQAALKQSVVLEPVVAGNEGDQVLVPAGFDPSAIRVLGNVTGQPPYKGEVQHPGWRIKEWKVQPVPSGQDDSVIQPAEVQLA